MNILLLLAPFSVFLGLLAVGAFVWTLRTSQYDDIQGAAERILIDDDDQPDAPEAGDAAGR
jgi:cbb3-type cytochrome oxidase maturation protein